MAYLSNVMTKTALLLILLCITIIHSCAAQVVPKDIKAQMTVLDNICQTCLDAGSIPFSECEKNRQRKLDTMLNTVYRELRITLDQETIEKLKKDERAWLKKRNANIEQEQSKIGRSDAGIDADEAMAIASDSYFIEQRILELLKKLKT